MIRLPAALMTVAALGSVAPAAAGQLPILQSAKVVHRHAVLELSVGVLRPVEFTAANGRALDARGASLPKGIRLRETIQVPASASGVVRWRSPRALRPGTYFVQVKAIETGAGGVTDCPPKQRDCNTHWSGLRRVVVRK